VKLATNLQPVAMSIKLGSLHPLPHTPSWSDYVVKDRDNFILLINAAVSSLGRRASNDNINHKHNERESMWIEAIVVQFQVISQNFPGGTDENHGKYKFRVIGVPVEIRIGDSRIGVVLRRETACWLPTSTVGRVTGR
jgi:hypothetical protein